MHELLLALVLAAHPASNATDVRPPQVSLAQSRVLSTKCVTPTIICFLDEPLPVGHPCDCNGILGTILN